MKDDRQRTIWDLLAEGVGEVVGAEVERNLENWKERQLRKIQEKAEARAARLYGPRDDEADDVVEAEVIE